MAYIDSNVFIYSVLYSKEADPRVKRAGEILTSIAKGELLAFTSTLTWNEVVWAVIKERKTTLTAYLSQYSLVRRN